MSTINNIIPNGSRIVTKIGSIEAIVLGVCVRGLSNQSIEYHIGFYTNGKYNTEWLHSFEIGVKIDNSKPAGFQRQNTTPLLDKP